MSFFTEVKDKLGLSDASDGYNMINYDGRAVYIEGFRKVLVIEQDLITFDCRKTVVSVSGEDLTVTELDDGSAVIKGRIFTVDCGAKKSEKKERKSRDKKPDLKKGATFGDFFGGAR